MKIALHSYQLGSRGTEICLYKYAKYAREILGWDPIIVSTSSRPTPTLERFEREFDVHLYPHVWQPDGKNTEIVRYFNDLISKENIDLMYAIKGGENDGILRELDCQSAAHCIFRMDEPHGSVYAGVCKYISKKHGLFHPWVDHIIDYKKLPPEENYRETFGIPRDALVGFRHGGNDTFSLNFVHNSIARALEKRKDLWFIFLNTRKFIEHPRVLFVDWTADLEKILKFVNTGDFFMHARYDGEIFPLTVAEASTQNKPVVTWRPDNTPAHYDTGHIDLLQETGIYYKDSQDLYETLINLERSDIIKREWDVYGDIYSPNKVMKQFKEIFVG